MVAPCEAHATLNNCMSSGLLDNAPDQSVQIPSLAAYGAAVFCVIFTSGGLLFGTGPFANKLANEGYIKPSDVATIFDGAMMIMTWGAVISTHASGCLGPRLSSLAGLLLQLPGFVTLAFLPRPVDPHLLLAACGAIGAGGYPVFVGCFSFAQLLPAARARVAGGVLTGLFNVSGLVFMLLNFDAFSFHAFFRGYLVILLLVFALVLLVFPDRPYSPGDRACLSRPTLAHVKNPFSASMYRSAAPSVLSPRFLAFGIQLALSTVYATYLLGLVSEPIYAFGKQHGWYASWAVPVATNAVVLISWTIPVLVDRSSLGTAGLLLAAACTAATALSLLTHSTAAALGNLLVLNVLQALQFSLPFLFLHSAVREDGFTGGLVGMLAMEGCFGLLPWPVFQEAFAHQRVSVLMFLLLASPLLYIWPILELWLGGDWTNRTR